MRAVLLSLAAGGGAFRPVRQSEIEVWRKETWCDGSWLRRERLDRARPARQSSEGVDRTLEVRRGDEVAVARSVLSRDFAGMAFADLELLHQMGDGVPAVSRAQTFPRLRSFNIEMSRARSATIRFSLAFSCSNVLSRIASSSFNAPYFVRHR